MVHISFENIRQSQSGRLQYYILNCDILLYLKAAFNVRVIEFHDGKYGIDEMGILYNSLVQNVKRDLPLISDSMYGESDYLQLRLSFIDAEQLGMHVLG